jgi:hypothetical protein
MHYDQTLENVTLSAALKQRKIIPERIRENIRLIQTYASQGDNEKPLLGDAETQKNKIRELVQANDDLVQRFMDIKACLEYTNIITPVTIGKREYTIAQLIQYKRMLHPLKHGTLTAMNDMNFSSKSGRGTGAGEKIERYYDEGWKQEKLRESQDFYNEIDIVLETVNATTTLKIPPVV